MFLLGIIAGCGDFAIGPRLRYGDIRLDEQTTPLPFVVNLHNTGDEAATIKSVSVQVLKRTLISRRPDSVPSAFEYAVEFEEGHPTQIAAGEKGVACGFLRWSLPADSPPMLAVVRCVFVVDYDDDQQIETEPITLMLQSRAGLMKIDPSGLDALVAQDQAATTLESLSAIPGRRSHGFAALLRRLEALANEQP